MNKHGFTLIELLVAAGVISFVSVIITQVLFSSIHLNTKTEVIKELKQTGEMTMGMISRLIQNATTITTTQCNLSSDDPKQPVSSVEITGLDGGITTIECVDDAIAGVSRIASMSASRIDPLYITNSNVTLIDNSGVSGCVNQPLQFTCVGVGGIPSSLSVSFRLRQKNLAATSYESAMEIFQTTISVRNSTNE
ncbi:MAG: hypothetical protein UU25_C0001G0018 [Microgenomates group bacterium GW2011_GWB1_40_9]|nr:MAG: hypothetical protein UT26_C0005G0007 [Microgenomates group bacterium GW2011_GWC1_39_12]KKR80107.1 MAG: hypothetical protein UU25_C0001G0018 [Microgenomates group bacterium GW2011_GWB1_40_9]